MTRSDPEGQEGRQAVGDGSHGATSFKGEAASLIEAADGARPQQGPLDDELMGGTADRALLAAADPAMKQALIFLRVLDRTAVRFDILALDDVTPDPPAEGEKPTSKRPAEPFMNSSLGGVWSKLQPLNSDRFGVFVTVNATNGRGRKAANVTRVRAIIADCDGVDPALLVAALPPHMAVKTSPGKWHLYWIVADCALEQFKPIQKALNSKYGTDINVNDLPRVMRLPGFLHNKNAPYKVRLDQKLVPVANMERPAYTVREIIDGLGLADALAAQGQRSKVASADRAAVKRADEDGEASDFDFTGASAIAKGELPEVWSRREPPGATDANVAIVKAMLAVLDPDMDRKQWLKVVWGVRALDWARGPELVREWSATAKKEKNQGQDGLDELVEGFDANHPGGAVGFGTFVMMVRAAGYTGQLPGKAGAGGAVGADGALRPLIMVEKGEIASTASKAEDALLAAGVPIYQRGGRLVVPVRNSVKLASGRTALTASFKQVDVPTLVDLLNRCADFQRFDGRSNKEVRINPPRDVAETLLSRAGEWPFRRIAGCVTAPMLRGDGSLLNAPGYDEATELHHFRDPDLLMPAMPEAPTRADAEAALAALMGLLDGFPFVGPTDRVVALCALMTAVLRGGMPTAPLHLIRAHTAGTGKSFLVDLATTLAAGHPAPAMSIGKGAEELEKRLGAAMLDGSPFVNLDNANGEVGGDMLCQVAERPSVAIRVLGQSKVSHVECRATVFCNGNNTTIVGDLVRRTMTCNLDAGVENPEARRFPSDPMARVQVERGRYLAAVLTIARAYRAAGCPEACPPLAPLGSYADWARAVREPLVWLGLADPVASQDAARAEDPARASIRELMALWEATPTLKPDTFYKAKQLRDVAELHPDFRDFLFRHCGSGGTVSTKALGTFLTRIHGQVLDGRKIVRRPDGVHGHLYALVEMAETG